MSVGRDRKEELRDLYVMQCKSLSYIADKLDYATPTKVADELKEKDIPLRHIDEAKISIQLQKQADKKTNLVSALIQANSAVIFSESLDVRDYTKLQICLSFSAKGTPTGASIDILIQLAFKSNPNVWFDLADTAVASLNAALADMPYTKCFTADDLGGDFIRIKLIGSSAGTLNATNYFIINGVTITFFGF